MENPTLDIALAAQSFKQLIKQDCQSISMLSKSLEGLHRKLWKWPDARQEALWWPEVTKEGGRATGWDPQHPHRTWCTGKACYGLHPHTTTEAWPVPRLHDWKDQWKDQRGVWSYPQRCSHLPHPRLVQILHEDSTAATQGLLQWHPLNRERLQCLDQTINNQIAWNPFQLSLTVHYHSALF